MGALTPRWVPGLLCHLDDACVSNPCHKDAICDTNPVNGRAICTCPPGFTGGACDQDVDECSIGGWGAPMGGGGGRHLFLVVGNHPWAESIGGTVPP